ncbi:MAG: phosphopantetheine-binding protein [Bacteroidales bacterium]
MEDKVLGIINFIRISKDLEPLTSLCYSDNLRSHIGFTSFDLAELTVRIEDEFDVDVFENGLVETVGEVFEKLSK